MRIKILTTIVILFGSLNGLKAQSILNDLVISYSNSYDSKYISEGRCNLTSGGLGSFNTDISYYWLNINMWYGTGFDIGYRELQLSAGISLDFSDIDMSLGLTNLSFLHDDSKDQEFFSELSYNKIDWITPTLANVYSFEAEGSFLELLIEFNIPIKNEQLDLVPFLLEGFDLGFVEEEVCLNNLQIGVELYYQIIDYLSINIYVASSFGVWNESPHENHTWGGLGISTNF